jgi:hypothetical protein
MKVTQELTTRRSTTVSPDALIAEFGEEWRDYMEGGEGEATEEDRVEFVRESVHVMGGDFFEEDAPWIVDSVDVDEDMTVTVAP